MPPEVAKALKKAGGATRCAARGEVPDASRTRSLRTDPGHAAGGAAGVLRHRRPALGRDRWVAAVTPAVAGQFVMVATAVGCLFTSFVNLRFLGALRRREFQLRAAAVLSRRRAVGRARRLAAAVDFPARLLDGGCRHRRAQPAAAVRRARAGRVGRGELRIPAVHAGHFESVPAPDPAGAGRTRPESDPAGSGARHSSADSLHGLCGIRRGVRIRLRGDARRPHGPDWARWTRPGRQRPGRF